MPKRIRSVSLAGKRYVDQHGITWDGSNWWILDNDLRALFKVDERMNTIERIDSKHARTGVSWADGAFWVGRGRVGGFSKIDMTGREMKRIREDLGGAGIEYDGEHLFVTMVAFRGGPGVVCKLDSKTGETLDKRKIPGARDLNGVVSVGPYLFIADDNVDHIFVIRKDTLEPTGEGFDDPGWAWGVAWNGENLGVVHRGGRPVPARGPDEFRVWDISDIVRPVKPAPWWERHWKEIAIGTAIGAGAVLAMKGE